MDHAMSVDIAISYLYCRKFMQKAKPHRNTASLAKGRQVRVYRLALKKASILSKGMTSMLSYRSV